MEEKVKRRLRTLFITYILLGAIAIGGILLLNKHVLDCTEDYMEHAGLDILEDQLVERVDNLVIRIDNHRNDTYERAQMLCGLISAQTLNGKNCKQAAANWFEVLKQSDRDMCVQIVLRTADEIFHSRGGNMTDISQFDPEKIREYIMKDSVYRFFEQDGKEIGVFAKYEDLDAEVERFAYNLIYAANFGKEGYAWIDKIVDYNGGDHFAIRLVHPNVPEQEGKYLSVDEQDIMGNYPYRVELDAIKANGKMMQRYYFKNYSSDEVEEKVAYGMLYEPYDWFIASGEPIGQIDVMVADTLGDAKNAVIYSTALVVMILFLSGVVIGVLGYVNTKKLSTTVSNYVFEETKLDSLTGVFTRNGGTQLLKQDWQEAILKQEPLLILLLDVDNFKKVNDTYGHDVGDVVLKDTCSAIHAHIRKTDYMIRWGGEEFIVVCKDVDPELSSVVAEKILSAVRELTFCGGSGSFHVSVSIGGAWSKTEDVSYEVTLKRADQALYAAKNAGKDCFVAAE